MKEPCQYPKKIESVDPPAGKYPLLLEPIHSVLVSSKMSFSTDQLIALQALVAKELMNRSSSSSSSAPVKDKKVKKEKDPSAKPRKAGAWAGWTSHCPKEHAAEYETFKASSATKQGIAPLFCTQWRKDHADEYAAFEVKWKEEHSSAEPSSAEPSSAEPSPASSAPAPAPAPAPAAPQKVSQDVKVRKPQSEETKAAAALKRAATKAKNAAEGASALAAAVTSAAPAPAPAPVLPLAPISIPAPAQEAEAEAEEDEEMPELLPFKLGGRSYLRPGVLRDGGITSWATGDLWESKKDVKGDWAGVLQEDGSIDLSAEEPEC